MEEYHSGIRVQVGNYIRAKRWYFEDFIDVDFNQYVSLIRDTDYRRGNHELTSFSKLYWVNIEVYDRIALNHSRYVIKNEIHQPTIWLFYSGDRNNSIILHNFDKEWAK